MTTEALILLPEPGDTPLPVVLEQCRRLWARRLTLRVKPELAAEAIRRARMVEEYCRRRDGHDDALRAARALEAAVGEALGPASREHDRGKGAKLHASNLAITKFDRHRFRLMAAHRNVWEPECERRPLSRRQALQLIGAAVVHAPPPEPVADLVLTRPVVASKAGRYFTVKQWEVLSKEERADIITAGFEAKAAGLNEQSGDAIEWARWSHNTVTGCLHDCPYCYARDIAERLYPQKFAPTFHPERLAGPSRVAVPVDQARNDESYRNIFANSMSDLFGQWVPEDWIEATIEMARRTPRWNFLTLTKFPQRAADFDFPENWWMGTTVDAQARVKNAEQAFAKIRCKTKWLSLEPLLAPLEFSQMDLFQWVVIGGASASRKTPGWVPPFDWVLSVHRQAREARCRIYHKTNLELSEAMRVREFPWCRPVVPSLPTPFRYLRGM